MDDALIPLDETSERKASDRLMSYHPSGEGLTNFYWDDWAMSGLLKKGGATLTLGLAGGTGPGRLAATDPTHRQTAVDLDTSHFHRKAWPIEVVTDDAFRYVRTARERFDTIWVDLYSPESILPEVLSPDFLDRLRDLLKPRGSIFFHFFRPENRFYRYDRRSDPFEPLFAALAASRGLHAHVFDHFASQTWLLEDATPGDIAARLRDASRNLHVAERHWITDYMLRILRRPTLSREEGAPSHGLLREAFLAPVSAAALHACGLSWISGVADLDAWSETPEKLISGDLEANPANLLRWEVMALWITGVGLRLPLRCREHLMRVACLHRDTGSAEFEWRRELIADPRAVVGPSAQERMGLGPLEP